MDRLPAALYSYRHFLWFRRRREYQILLYSVGARTKVFYPGLTRSPCVKESTRPQHAFSSKYGGVKAIAEVWVLATNKTSVSEEKTPRMGQSALKTGLASNIGGNRLVDSCLKNLADTRAAWVANTLQYLLTA